jgi:hypothetical protein
MVMVKCGRLLPSSSLCFPFVFFSFGIQVGFGFGFERSFVKSGASEDLKIGQWCRGDVE